jgi:glycosyltransferase involved in cell wall biosynthesis
MKPAASKIRAMRAAIRAWLKARLPRSLAMAVAGFILQGNWFARQLGTITDTNNYDFVHCHDWVFLATGRRIAREAGAKLIYDSHELATRQNLQTRSNRLLTSIVERITWRHVDLLISVSQSIVDFYLQTYGPRKVLVVVNTPEVRGGNTPQGMGTVRTRSRCSREDVLAVYIGRFTSGRGIDAILEAAKLEVPGLHFAFLGSGPLGGTISLAVGELGNVSLIEPVDSDQVVSFLRDADVGLCLIEPVTLSYEYSLPNKLFESLFAGLRVVAYPRKEIAKVLEEVGGGVLFEQSTPEEIVRACFAAHSLRPANADALERYSPSRVGNSLVEAYRQLSD